MKLTFGVTSLLTASAAASPSPRGILKVQEMSNISRNSVAKYRINGAKKEQQWTNTLYLLLMEDLPMPYDNQWFSNLISGHSLTIFEILNDHWIHVKIGLCIQDFGILCVLYVCCWLDFVFFVGLWQVGLTLASPHGKAEGAQMVCEETQFAEN